MTASASDQNLLFAVMALQLDFVTQDDLIRGMNAWVLQKSSPLAEILRDSGVLAADAHDLLLALVSKHLERHHGDARESLKALASISSAHNQLSKVEDRDLQDTLFALDTRSKTDPDATLMRPPHAPNASLRYRILRPHAKGGVGEVFVAEDLEVHRQVAFKEIQFEHAFDPQNRNRFIVEAEITGRLEHPGIVPVYGIGTYVDGRPYYAMQLIKGDNLMEAIHRFHRTSWDSPADENLALRQLLRRFVDICNAIAYAHSRGVLHRDLKPSNVMLGQFGETFVVDWGLAKALGKRDASTTAIFKDTSLIPSSGSGADVTQQGDVLGTPAYMSPEQAAGRTDELNASTDIYSLGATLYTMLAGQPPYQGDVADVLHQVTTGQIRSLRQIKSNIPRMLESICLKAMALDPVDRHATCFELAAEIEHWLGIEARQKERRLRLDSDLHRAHALYERAYLTLERDNRMACLLWLAKSLESAEAIGSQLDGESDPEQHRRLSTLARSSRMSLAALTYELPALQMIFEHSDGVTSLSLGKTCEKFVTGCNDRTVRLWHGVTGEPLGAALRHESSVTAVALSSDGSLLVSGTRDGSIRAWNADSFELLWQATKIGDYVRGLALSPDGTKFACTTSTLALWGDVATGEVINVILPRKSRQNRWYTLAIRHDGTSIAVGGDDNVARLWDVSRCQAAAKPMEHGGRVNAISFNPQGTLLITGCDDGQAVLWDVATQEPLLAPLRHDDSVLCVAFAPDGKCLATGSRDKTVRVWDVQTGRQIGQSLPHERSVTTIEFGFHGDNIFTGCADGKARIWQAARHQRSCLALRHSGNEPVRRAAFTPDGSKVLTRCGDHECRLWNSSSGELLSLGSAESKMDFGPGGMIINSSESSSRLWNKSTGAPIVERLGKDASIIGFSPDCRIVATIESHPEMAVLRDVFTGTQIGQPLPHTLTFPVVFSDNGSKLITACSETAIRVWDSSTGLPLGEALIHSELVICSAFSRDGSSVLTGCIDGTAWLWNVSTSKLIGEPLRHGGHVRVVAFVADDLIAAAASDDGQASLWDATTGKILCAFNGHQGEAWCIGFSSDGKQVVFGNRDATARIYPLPSVQLAADARRIRVWIEVLSGQRLNENGLSEFLSRKEWHVRCQELVELGGPPQPVVPESSKVNADGDGLRSHEGASTCEP